MRPSAPLAPRGFDTSPFSAVGKSSAARKQDLRKKYDAMTVDQLRKAAMENLLRAQRQAGHSRRTA